ncbi:MAG: phosphoenolpyruvate kinase [Deltaproteobacteria bacterium]|nr:MAG: phosphoenolpyruvate kinase [Deltaproteobacteria bacterium]
MKTSLDAAVLAPIDDRLQAAHERFAQRFPGERPDRQPVHTVYGGANLYKADSAAKLGRIAARMLDTFAPDPFTFARAVGLPGSETLPLRRAEIDAAVAEIERDPEGARRSWRAGWLAVRLYARIREKLDREPVEDFRIDYEDGYGNRPDEEEDRDAVGAAKEAARGKKEGTNPPFLGIRIKPLTRELRARAIRTLDLFLTTVVEELEGGLPDHFVVTLPKVCYPEQVEALDRLLLALEEKLGLEAGRVKVEVMVETPQAVFAADGRIALPDLVAAGGGRVIGAHFGTYDYTASVGIVAAYQDMLHPACDFAKHVMQVALAGTGVWLSDGATTIMPIAPHRGESLSAAEIEENLRTVHAAWRLHYRQARHSLETGFYQGWDLHPGQLPTRYAAVFSMFLESLEQMSRRLSHFVEQAAKATLVGDAFDDAATGQGLLNFFLRAISAGAITEEEAMQLSGLTLDELRSRSFVQILKGRREG